MEFATLKGGVDRAQRPTKAQAPWVSQQTWRLADRRTELQRAGRAITMDTRQARWEFQRALQADRRKIVQDAVTSIESLMKTGEIQEVWVSIY